MAIFDIRGLPRAYLAVKLDSLYTYIFDISQDVAIRPCSMAPNLSERICCRSKAMSTSIRTLAARHIQANWYSFSLSELGGLNRALHTSL